MADDHGDRDWEPVRKKAKTSRKKLNLTKGAMFATKPKRREKIPPPDHFLKKFPPEIRNIIYEYALDPKVWHLEAPKKRKRYTNSEEDRVEARPSARYYSTQDPRNITHIRDNEPGLLWACKNIRSEALGIYFRLNRLVLNVGVGQLASLERWVSSTYAGYDPKKPDQGYGNLGIYLLGLEWSDINSLLPLARIAQHHGDYFTAGYHDDYIVADFQVARKGYRPHRYEGVLRDVIELGHQAAEEDWPEEWLGFKFEELVEEAYEDVAARGRAALAKLPAMDVGLPGQWHATNNSQADERDKNNFSRVSMSRVGTSDRKLRSRGQETRDNYAFI